MFHSVKVNVDIEPPYLKAGTLSELTIKVYPINTLGFRNPIGHSEVRFEVEEGGNLIELLHTTPEAVTVKSKGIEGEAIVGIYTLRSGVMVSKVIIKILPLDKA